MNHKLLFPILLVLLLQGCDSSPQVVSNHTVSCQPLDIEFVTYQEEIGFAVSTYVTKIYSQTNPIGTIQIHFPKIAYKLKDMHLRQLVNNIAGEENFVHMYIDHNTTNKEAFEQISQCVENNLDSINSHLKKMPIETFAPFTRQLGSVIHGSSEYFGAKIQESPFQFSCSEHPTDYVRLGQSVYRHTGGQAFLLWTIEPTDQNDVFVFTRHNHGSNTLRKVDHCRNKYDQTILEYFKSQKAILKEKPVTK